MNARYDPSTGLPAKLPKDGRAIIRGTGDVGLARSLYARWLGG